MNSHTSFWREEFWAKPESKSWRAWDPRPESRAKQGRYREKGSVSTSPEVLKQKPCNLVCISSKYIFNNDYFLFIFKFAMNNNINNNNNTQLIMGHMSVRNIKWIMHLHECVMLVTPLVLKGLDPRSLPLKTILYLLTHILVSCFRCPVLLVTGQQSIFNGTTRSLHQAIVKSCEDKTKVEFIEVVGVANVLEEKVVISYSG